MGRCLLVIVLAALSYGATGAHAANWPQWRPRFKVLVPPSELATVGLLEREKLAMAT